MESDTLLVDIGNTNTKFRINNTDSSIANKNFDSACIPQHHQAVISAVAHKEYINYFHQPILAVVQPYQDLIFSHPQQLGIDRYLALIAASHLYPQQDIMLIDIGTFVTIDYIKKNKHQRGGIAPGLEKLQQSANFSAAESKTDWNLGTQNMLLHYVQYTTDNFNGKVLLTGGDAKMIPLPKADYHTNLVLDGLKFYIQHFLQ